MRSLVPKSAAIAYTLIETAKLNGIDPLGWLTDVLSRIADHKINKNRRAAALAMRSDRLIRATARTLTMRQQMCRQLAGANWRQLSAGRDGGDADRPTALASSNGGHSRARICKFYRSRKLAGLMKINRIFVSTSRRPDKGCDKMMPPDCGAIWRPGHPLSQRASRPRSIENGGPGGHLDARIETLATFEASWINVGEYS